MEGPSLHLAAEQLAPFRGRAIMSVAGNTKIGKERLQGRKVKDVFAWGKHLVFQFDDFALRIHFMLYGTFAATVKGKSVTGDYRRTGPPRLVLEFPNGEITIHAASLRYVESAAAKKDYDFSTDIMAPEWDSPAARKKMRNAGDEEIADVLLDQEIFAGVGNIIKNEVLFLSRVNPETRVSSLSPAKLREIAERTRDFSHRFYELRKVFLLKKNLLIYRKSVCPVCGSKVIRKKTGRRQRWSFFCPSCQPLKMRKGSGSR